MGSSGMVCTAVTGDGTVETVTTVTGDTTTVDVTVATGGRSATTVAVMATDGEVVVEESGLEESVREGIVVGAWVDETAAAVLTVVFTLLELALVPVFVPAPPGPAPPTRRGLSSDC